jgi:lipoate synthase
LWRERVKPATRELRRNRTPAGIRAGKQCVRRSMFCGIIDDQETTRDGSRCRRFAHNVSSMKLANVVSRQMQTILL